MKPVPPSVGRLLVRLGALALLLAAATTSAAELIDLERTVIQVDDSDDTRTSQLVTLAFTTRGAVKRLEATSSCSCVQALQEHATYRADEHGELLCWVTFGQTQGEQRRVLTLTATGFDGSTQTVAVPCRLVLRRFISVSDDLPTWDMHAPVVEKVIDVTLASGFGRLASIEREERLLPEAWIEALDDRHYRVHLRPVATVEHTEASDFYLRFDTTVERMKRYRVPFVLALP